MQRGAVNKILRFTQDDIEKPAARGPPVGVWGIIWFYNKCWGQAMNLTPKL